MGFFSLKATCALCGKEIGLNRYLIAKTASGKELWKCPECTRKGGAIRIVGDRAFLIENKDTEVRQRCNACGHVFCYTMDDLQRNRKEANKAIMSSIGGMAGALSGNYAAAAVNNSLADSQMNRITDYTRCPKCNSTDLSVISKEESAAALKSEQTPALGTVSVADELKKFKELLDMGVITEEEFNAQKAKLLGQ